VWYCLPFWDHHGSLANLNVYAVRPHHWDPRTRLHGVVIQKTIVVIEFTAAKASNLYKNFGSECWILVGKPGGKELFDLLHGIWLDIIKVVIILIVCGSVTLIICAPILRTDHFRLRCQKDQRASPRIRLMYKAEMQSVCCQRQLCVGRHTAEARLFQSQSAGCKAVCDPLAIHTDQISSVLQLTFCGNTNPTCRRLLLLQPSRR